MRALLLCLCLAAASPAGALAPMPTARYGVSVVVARGKLYAIGGAVGQHVLSAVERYDPAADSWTRLAPLPSPRGYAAAAAVGDKIYVIGGWSEEGDHMPLMGAVDVLDTRTGAWTSGPPIPRHCAFCSAVAVGEKIFVAGGQESTTAGKVPSVSVLDTRSGRWSDGPPMPLSRGHAGIALLDGRIWVGGGAGGDGDPARVNAPLSSVVSYSPVTDSWRYEAGLPWSGASGLAAAGGRLYAFGGSDKTRPDIASLAVFNGEQWLDAPPMPTGRSSLGYASDGKRIFVVGGSPGRNIALDTLEIYDTASGAWSSSGPSKPSVAVVSRPAAPSPPAPAPAFSPAAADDLPAPASVKPRPDDFALVIGLEDYRSVMAAQYGRQDAEAFARYAKARLGVPEENVILLTGDKATRTDITKYVEQWLPRNVEKDSRVYVYYSGHGAPDPERGGSYLLPWDGDPQFLETSGYPLTRLYERLAALPARHVVVFLDACFSGAGGRSVIAKNLRPLVHVEQTPAPKGRLTIFSASGASQVAGGYDAKRHGLFTYYLLRGLGGDAASGGHEDISALYSYVRANVRKRAHRENRDQDPQLQTREPALRLY